MMQVIAYIDMNSFFVSCHENENQNLKNKPVAVSNNSRRSVIASASYCARKYHIKSGMPLYQALKLCNNLIIINPRRYLYTSYSNKIFNFLNQNFTNLIEQSSIDEFCLDITNLYKKYYSVLKCCEEIQRAIKEELNLPCSIGASYNKNLAKIASKLKKPEGISLITPYNINQILLPLKIELIPGIGPKTADKLKLIKINKIKELILKTNEEQIKKILGKKYFEIIDYLKPNYLNNKELILKKRIRKSVGRDHTLQYDSNDQSFLILILRKLIKMVIKSANKNEFTAEVVSCGIKINNKWHSKQMKLKIPTNNEETIKKIIIILFYDIWKPNYNIRALRVNFKRK